MTRVFRGWCSFCDSKIERAGVCPRPECLDKARADAMRGVRCLDDRAGLNYIQIDGRLGRRWDLANATDTSRGLALDLLNMKELDLKAAQASLLKKTEPLEAPSDPVPPTLRALKSGEEYIWGAEGKAIGIAGAALGSSITFDQLEQYERQLIESNAAWPKVEVGQRWEWIADDHTNLRRHTVKTVDEINGDTAWLTNATSMQLTVDGRVANRQNWTFVSHASIDTPFVVLQSRWRSVFDGKVYTVVDVLKDDRVCRAELRWGNMPATMFLNESSRSPIYPNDWEFVSDAPKSSGMFLGWSIDL